MAPWHVGSIVIDAYDPGWDWQAQGWRYKLGDNAAWADPNYDDSGWAVEQAPFADATARHDIGTPADWPFPSKVLFPLNSTIWIRRKLASGAKQMSFRIDNEAWVYMDGTLIYHVSGSATSTAPVTINTSGVLAIRCADYGITSYLDCKMAPA